MGEGTGHSSFSLHDSTTAPWNSKPDSNGNGKPIKDKHVRDKAAVKI